MIFNSHEFLFLFLPITIGGFFLTYQLRGRQTGIIWLLVASLFFYGYWNPPYVLLLLLSMGINYGLGQQLTQAHAIDNPRLTKTLLWCGITFNLGLIGYYKYFNFFLENLNGIFGTSWSGWEILLPLGISFYTFQQIAYLVDSSAGETQGYRLIDYCLFVSFFPQLIAGPIVSHQEIIPQFAQRQRFKSDDLAIGITILAVGLFKKVILADSIATYASSVFGAVDAGMPISGLEAWFGALAYTMQIYFDFSGYSDMAIGAARMLGFKLPINFNSPYKATSIIDFWQRWHITLTQFLNRYLYNPITLTLSRWRMQKGLPVIRRGKGSPAAFSQQIAVPTVVTMFLAGLWHGAGWTYLIFGCLHGFYLVVNQAWNMWRKHQGHNLKQVSRCEQYLSHMATFVCVVIAMVCFRATSVNSFLNLLTAMVGVNDWLTITQIFPSGLAEVDLMPNGLFSKTAGCLLAGLMGIVFCLPNTQEWMAQYNSTVDMNSKRKGAEKSVVGQIWQHLNWHPTQRWAVLTAVMLLTAVLELSTVSEFIYFQF